MDLATVQTVQELAAALRRLRRREARAHSAAQLTYRELAAKAGWSRGILGEYFGGRVLPPTDRFDVLIRLLGASPGEQRALATARDRVEENRRGAAGPSRRAVAGQPIPRQLPPPVRHFAGRVVELAALTDLLEEAAAHGGTVVISAISGIAGVGKTALAVHYGHRAADRFPDGQLYVNLRGFDASVAPVGPAEAIRVFLDALDVPPRRIPSDLAAQTALFRSLLAGRRMLVVLDNARDAEQVRPLLPGSPGCLAIVTSRSQLSSLVTAEDAHLVTLDVLSTVEAYGLLTRRLGAARVAAEPDAVAEIITRCAGLPLALSLVASRATSHAGFPLAALADELGRTTGSLDAFADTEPATDIRTVFAWSYRALRPAAARVFRLMSLHPGTDICADAVAALAGRPADETRAALAELTHAHLVTEHVPDRFILHDLLRVYAAEQSRAVDAELDRAAAIDRLLTWYWHTADAATRLLYPEVTRLPRTPLTAPPAAPELPDGGAALAWLDTERRNLLMVCGLAARTGSRPFAWMLADVLRIYLRTQKHTTDWLAMADTALTAAQAEGDLTAQAAAELSLGEANAHIGPWAQAIEHNTRALDLARQAGWIKGEVQALISLANGFMFLGRLPEAIDLSRQAETRARHEGDLFSQARSVMSRGLAMLFQGRLREAADHVVRAGALFQQRGSRSYEGTVRLNLGEIYYHLGWLDAAIEHLGHALEVVQEMGHRRAEADILRILAAVHRDLGDYQRALELADAALGSAHDAGHWVETDTLNVHGSIEQRLRRHRSARGSHERALALARRAGASYQRADALTLLATAHHALDDPDRARRCADEALAISRRAGYRLLEGRALVALAAVELDDGGLDGAADLARQAVAIQRETGHRLGEARALVLLGQALRHTKPGATEAHWRQAYDLFADIGTPEADDVKDLLGQLRSGAAPG